MITDHRYEKQRTRLSKYLAYKDRNKTQGTNMNLIYNFQFPQNPIF